MERTSISATEIQQVLEDRINAQQEVMQKHDHIAVQIPQWNEPDGSGCNWHVEFSGDIVGHEALISQAVTELQGKYNLLH